jgi:hypothetical protein
MLKQKMMEWALSVTCNFNMQLSRKEAYGALHLTRRDNKANRHVPKAPE